MRKDRHKNQHKLKIVKKIRKEIGFSREETYKIIGEIFRAMIDIIAETGHLELLGFMSFNVKHRKGQFMNNNGHYVPAHNLVKVKFGKKFKDRLAQLPIDNPTDQQDGTSDNKE